MAGCTNPNAVNFDSAENVEDYSCLYLFKHNGTCHLFKDVQPEEVEDKSFTVSFSMKGNNWIFFHDYFPDMYIHTPDNNLWTLKDNVFYQHNSGEPGVYYDTTPKPFFIDLVFLSEIRKSLGMVGSDAFKQTGDMILNSVQWVSEYLDRGVDQPYKTLTHISIWDSYQHTGRVPMDKAFKALKNNTNRRTQGSWSFDKFRDILQSDGSQFLFDLFNDYKLDSTKVPTYIPWYNKKMMQDQWFCVRFEFDNLSGASIQVHDMIIQANKTDR